MTNKRNVWYLDNGRGVWWMRTQRVDIEMTRRPVENQWVVSIYIMGWGNHFLPGNLSADEAKQKAVELYQTIANGLAEDANSL